MSHFMVRISGVKSNAKKPTPQWALAFLVTRPRSFAFLLWQKLLCCRRPAGGCVNDCVIHLATSNMGFGGVGESGMGSYHGKTGFDTFSHNKSILNKKTWMYLPMRYQPYKRGLYGKLLRFFLR